MAVTPVDVGGSLAKGLQVNQMRQQLEAQKAQQQERNALKSLYAERFGGADPKTGITWDTGRQAPAAQGGGPAMTNEQFAGRAMAINPQVGLDWQKHFAGQDAAQLERQKIEAPLMVAAFENVQDQASYDRARQWLASQNVDVSDIAPQYDPSTTNMVVQGSRYLAGIAEPKPPAASPIGKLIAERDALPPNDPRRAVYDDAIKKASTNAPPAQTNVTVGGGKYGTIPPGWELIEGPEGAYMRPVEGGPVAREIEAEARAAEERSGAQTQTDAGKAETMLDATGSIKEIMKDASTPVTGTSSRPFALLSGTAAGQVRSYVGTLKSGVALGAIQRLKEASATGATGFGAMNEAELQLLIDDIGALEPDTTEPEIFMKTIDRIERRYNRVVEDIRENVSPERIRELGLEPLLASAGGGEGKAMDFSAMAPQDLLAVDATKLNTEQLDALLKAMDEAGL